ncbi:MAG TPA: hypothetical protein VGK32_03940 [Vicinamibacterales bacterium]|jgi:hypothetical protein
MADVVTTPRGRADDWWRPSAIFNVLTASGLAALAVAVWVLFVAGGWDYYATPLRVRAYAPAHRMLDPSGPIGHVLGVVGLLMMLVPVAYSVRKKWKRLSNLGQMKHWLDVHVFCGTVGPVLVTFHAAMKFNGVISVAYWSMVAVVLSGFVGRYLYVRLPRTIRGTELSYDQILTRAVGLRTNLAATGVDPSLLAEIDAAERAVQPTYDAASWWDYLVSPVRDYVRLRGVHRRLRRAGLDRQRVHEVTRLAGDRALLLRRLAYLDRTRRLFALWHVFHQPLVYVMFGIALVHIVLAIYFGYAYLLQG